MPITAKKKVQKGDLKCICLAFALYLLTGITLHNAVNILKHKCNQVSLFEFSVYNSSLTCQNFRDDPCTISSKSPRLIPPSSGHGNWEFDFLLCLIGGEFEHFPTLPRWEVVGRKTCSSPVPKVFVPSTRIAHLQYNKCVCRLFGRWFGNPPKRTQSTIIFLWDLISFRDAYVSEKNYSNNAEMKDTRRPLHLLCISCRCKIVFLHSLISVLFLSIFQDHPYVKLGKTSFYKS